MYQEGRGKLYHPIGLYVRKQFDRMSKVVYRTHSIKVWVETISSAIRLAVEMIVSNNV